MKKLTSDDARTIDLLLDRDASKALDGANQPAFSAPVESGFEARLEGVERVLGLIGQMPAEDPSEQLVSRTMKRINAALAEPLELSEGTALGSGDTHFPA